MRHLYHRLQGVRAEIDILGIDIWEIRPSSTSRSNGDRPDPPLQMDGSRSFQQDSSPPQEAAPSANLQAVSKSPAVPKDALLEKVQGLEARMRQLTQQSEALRKKFGQASDSSPFPSFEAKIGVLSPACLASPIPDKTGYR